MPPLFSSTPPSFSFTPSLLISTALAEFPPPLTLVEFHPTRNPSCQHVYNGLRASLSAEFIHLTSTRSMDIKQRIFGLYQYCVESSLNVSLNLWTAGGWGDFLLNQNPVKFEVSVKINPEQNKNLNKPEKKKTGKSRSCLYSSWFSGAARAASLNAGSYGAAEVGSSGAAGAGSHRAGSHGAGSPLELVPLEPLEQVPLELVPLEHVPIELILLEWVETGNPWASRILTRFC